ncbi:CopD family protein [Lentibacter algarum]|uniref:CopD family protein n=1 Tax=Lentibacter algarum TaxID=576131 RepID=UPI001C083B96|nr:CopD family protein [Lentibacter algarum]MBU2982843.1 CopD family protein [Lentibacter algarum]
MDYVKIIHLLCVMGWMTSVFAVPRALIFWKREYTQLGAFGPTGDLTVRLYRFSAGLGVIGVLTGLWLGWQVWSFAPWVWLKLGLVALLAAHYIWTGVLVVRARKGEFGESDTYLRIFNEVSVLVVIAILATVVFKPF